MTGIQSSERKQVKQETKLAGVGVISKVLRILETIQASASPLALRDICEQTKINKTTAYRFVTHLEREGYLFRDGSGRYSFAMRLLHLAAHVDPQVALGEMARAYLHELWQTTSETVSFAVLDKTEVLYLEVLESPHVFRMASKAGFRRPVYSTALGKALTAFLPPEKREAILRAQNFEAFTPRTITDLREIKKELERVRRRGYAMDDEESVLGARCLGVPVLSHLQEAVASISVSGPTTRVDQTRIPGIVRKLQKASRSISERMGFRNRPGNDEPSGYP
jgi:DNA-binding IclR family transcriptional regulator